MSLGKRVQANINVRKTRRNVKIGGEIWESCNRQRRQGVCVGELCKVRVMASCLGKKR